MRRVVLLGSFLAIVLLGSWLFFARTQGPHPLEVPIEAVHAFKKSSQKPTTAADSDPTGIATGTARNVRKVPHTTVKPLGNSIEFRVVDGYAIAYGDLLLGKPSEPVAGGRGTYDAPVPQHWDGSDIPYSISQDLPHPERVEKALTYLREKTPVNFVPYSGQKDAIQFETGTEHCLSLLGKVGGIQPIKLSPECQWQEVLHEVLHALGFVHEQTRSDRDQYLEILWDDIDEKYHDQFAMVPESFQEPLRGFPFDYHSVMLYQPNSFVVRPGLLNMRSLSAEPIHPTLEGLSDSDIRRLNKMFRGYE